MVDNVSISRPIEKPVARQTRRRGEAGYSLLMVVFLVATSLVLSAAVVPNVLTQGRREREQEAVWRGEQYERAIRLYFQKFGRYPTKVDDLTRQTNGVRFLRQAYTDPLNKDDGTWRFIYVGPNGQLIGSLRSQSLMQSLLTASALTGGSPLLGTGAPAPPPPPPGTPGAGTTPGAAPGTAASPGAGAVGQPGQQTGSSFSLGANPLQSQPQPLTGAVIGGNIIGVGSKVKQSSLMIYQGADTYEQWEFIANPLQQGAIPGQQAPANPNAAPATGQPGQPGQMALPGVQPQQGQPGLPGGPPVTSPAPGT